MKLIDSHCHLDDEKFELDREELIQEISQSEIDCLVSAGYSFASSIKAINLAQTYDFIFATCGISPNDIPQEEGKLWIEIKKLKEIIQKQKKGNNKIVAIGEIGLDYYWNKENKELQKKAFIAQIELANEVDLPIVIHTREAVMDTLAILKQHKVKQKGIFHCCPLNCELVKQGLTLGFYISLAGPITFKNAKNADEIIKIIPNDRILIETDSPYLAPEPVRGTRNNPMNVKFMAEKIAQVKQIAVEQVAEFTHQNTRRILNLENK